MANVKILKQTVYEAKPVRVDDVIPVPAGVATRWAKRRIAKLTDEAVTVGLPDDELVEDELEKIDSLVAKNAAESFDAKMVAEDEKEIDPESLPDDELVAYAKELGIKYAHSMSRVNILNKLKELKENADSE